MKLLITTQVIDINHPILGFFHRWVEEFAEHFERIDVICLEEGEHALPPHVYVHSLGKEHGVSKLRYVLNFYRLFWRGLQQKPTYVLFHMGAIYNWLAAPFYLLLPRRPTFYWWKTHGRVNWFGRQAARFVDRVYTAAPTSFPIAGDKVVAVGHAVDESFFTLRTITKTNTLRMLAVGRVTPIKNVLCSVQVTAALRQKGCAVQLRVVGPLDNTEYVAAVRREIDRLSLGEVVQLVGPLSSTQLLHEYHHADVLLHPAPAAGFDKVVLEAGLCGVFPVASTPACRGLLAPYGLFIHEEETTAFVDTIMRIRSLPESAQAEMATQLRANIISQHSITTLSERIFGSKQANDSEISKQYG